MCNMHDIVDIYWDITILATYIKFKSLHGCSVGTWHRCKESQHLLDDAVQVFEAHDGIQP